MHRPERASTRQFSSLTRWQRARALTLALVLALGLTTLPPLVDMLVDALRPPPDPVRIAYNRSPVRDGPRLLVPWTIEDPKPILEPRIERVDDRWVARDVLGTSRIEFAIEDPARAEDELIDWARSICDDFPRELYLFHSPSALRLPGSHDTAPVWHPLMRRLKEACPTFDVYQVVLVAYPH